MGNYRASIKHFRPLWGVRLSEIEIDGLQECLDDCPAGKRTREKMKALAGLLYKYAIPRHLATLNLGQYQIVTGNGGGDRRALPMEDVDIGNPVETVNGVSRHLYIPHSCRHTFATFLKGVTAPDKDKLELIGHTSTEMLRHYQDVNLADLRRITDAL